MTYKFNKETKGFSVETADTFSLYQGYSSKCLPAPNGVIVHLEAYPKTTIGLNILDDEITINGVLFEGTVKDLQLLLNNEVLFNEADGGGSGGEGGGPISANDITSGTLSDTRLSNNVVLINKTQTLTNKTLIDPVIDSKQDALVSGTNIKTVNGESVLGSGDIVISGGGGVSLGETSTTAYRGDRGKLAYDHSLLTNNPHTVTKSQVGLSNVDNTSDLNKPISTLTQAQLNLKQATLVSGTNLKTVNGNSLLGSGDLVISGGGGSTTDASLLTSGTLADARLSSNVALNSTLDYRLAVNYMITKSGANTIATPRIGSGLATYTNTNSALVFQQAIDAIRVGLGGKIVFDGDFTFTDNITITGYDAQFDPRVQISIEGLGYQSRITQNTTGKNIFVYKNKVSAILRNMYLVVGSNGASAILGDDTGTTPSYGEISIYEGIFENIKVQHSGTADAVLLKNFFNLQVTHLDVISTTQDAIALKGTSINAQNYGNSNFSFVHATGASAVGKSSVSIISDVPNHPINLLTFSNLSIGFGNIGLYMRGATSCTFLLADIEYTGRNIVMANGATGVNTGNNKFVNMYLYTNVGGTAIECASNSFGNDFNGRIESDNSTLIVINDTQQFQAANSYNIVTGYGLGANPTINITSQAFTPFMMRKVFDNITVMRGPYIIPDLTALVQNVIPSTGGTRNLGSTANFWAELFANNVSANIVRPRTTSNPLSLTSASSGAGIDFSLNNTTTKIGAFASSGEFIAQQGGTFTANASSQLSVNSTTKGSLPWPRMTVAQRAAIASPAVGLVGFATDLVTNDGTSGALQVSTASGLKTIAYTSDVNTLKVDTKTANYTLVLGDAGKLIQMNLAGDNTLTIPTNATVAFPIGTQILIRQMGVGQITLTPTGSVVLSSSIGLKTRVQHSSATLVKIATDEWMVSGDLTV